MNPFEPRRQLSLLIPEKYPLPPGHPLSVRTTRVSGPPKSGAAPPAIPPVIPDADALLRIVDAQTHLHARPTMFTLGNGTERDQIGMMSMYDANVYARADMEEFMDECREAALHYLAGDVDSLAKL